jgi:hypothetical protein
MRHIQLAIQYAVITETDKSEEDGVGRERRETIITCSGYIQIILQLELIKTMTKLNRGNEPWVIF